MGGSQFSTVLHHLHNRRRGNWLHKGKFLQLTVNNLASIKQVPVVVHFPKLNHKFIKCSY